MRAYNLRRSADVRCHPYIVDNPILAATRGALVKDRPFPEAPVGPQFRAARGDTTLQTKSIIFNTNFIIFNTKFIILNAKSNVVPSAGDDR